MKRHAQAEITGLIILLLVLTVALLIYLRFSSISSSPALQDEFKGKEFTQTFVSTIIRSEMRACTGEYQEVGLLLRNLAENSSGPCSSVGELKSALDDFFISQILPPTLTKWGFTYRLTLTQGTAMNSSVPPLLLYESTPPCDSHAERLPAGGQLIPLASGEAELFLEVCI